MRTSKPAPSKPGPSGRPLLLLQPLATGQGRGSGCGLLLGYRIAAMDDERESIQDLSSPEEEEEGEEEEEEEEKKEEEDEKEEEEEELG